MLAFHVHIHLQQHPPCEGYILSHPISFFHILPFQDTHAVILKKDRQRLLCPTLSMHKSHTTDPCVQGENHQ